MQIYMLLTENCNLNCSMCIRGKQNGVSIDLEQIKKWIWIDELLSHDVVITGGEPTLHPQFKEIVDYMCRHAKTVTVTTNGTTDYYLKDEFLRDNLYFQISLDGDETAHDEIRGNGVFTKTLSLIKKMDSMGVNYSIASVVSKKNINTMLNLEKCLCNLKNIRYWRISYEMPFGSADKENIMTANEWNQFVDYMLENVRFKMKIKKIFPFELYDKHKDKLEEMLIKQGRSFNCGSGKDKIYIYPDYNVYCCTCLTDFPLGNLKNQSLQKILNGESIQKFLNYKLKEESSCSSCEYKKFCNGGCIGMSYQFFGELGMGDMRCPKVGGRK